MLKQAGGQPLGQPQAASTETAMAGRLEPISDRVRAAFDIMADATVTVPRMHPAMAGRFRAPLGKLVSIGQNRDAFDQRIAHVEAAAARAEVAAEDVRAAIFAVTAMQIVEISCLLEQTAMVAGAAFAALLEGSAGAGEGDADLAATLAAIGHRGMQAAADLSGAVEVLNAEAAGHAALVSRAVTPEAIRAVDLGWMLALYTMEDERRIHRAAIEAICAPAP